MFFVLWVVLKIFFSWDFPQIFFFCESWTEYYVFLLLDDIFSSIFGKMSFIFGLSLAEMLPDVEFFVMFGMDCI